MPTKENNNKDKEVKIKVHFADKNGTRKDP